MVSNRCAVCYLNKGWPIASTPTTTQSIGCGYSMRCSIGRPSHPILYAPAAEPTSATPAAGPIYLGRTDESICAAGNAFAMTA